MPLSQRLTDLQEALDSKYRILGDAQKRLAYANDTFEKSSIKERLRKEELPEIRRLEADYWRLLSQELRSSTIDDDDANNVIFEVIETTETIRENDSSQYSSQYRDEVIQRLIEIQNKLSEPGKSSSAKLKAALPLLPPFISYEVELETQGILQRMFPTFSRLLEKAKKK